MELAPILPSVSSLDQGQLIIDNWVNGERLVGIPILPSSPSFSSSPSFPELSEFSDSPLPIIGLMG